MSGKTYASRGDMSLVPSPHEIIKRLLSVFPYVEVIQGQKNKAGGIHIVTSFLGTRCDPWVTRSVRGRYVPRDRPYDQSWPYHGVRLLEMNCEQTGGATSQRLH